MSEGVRAIEAPAAAPTAAMAAMVAVALVAACGVTGVEPEAVFKDGGGGNQTRVLAAATCVARLGWRKPDAARLFRIHANRLTPSGLVIAKVTVERMLVVAEALRLRGLLPGVDGGPPSNPPAAAEAATPRRKPQTVAARPGAKRPETTAAPPRSKPVAPARVANPVRRPTPDRITQLKPVNDRIVRWTRQQVAMGADLAFVADCFDVDPAALVEALRPMELAA